MLAFRSVQQGNHGVCEEFLYELKATMESVRSFSTNSRPALRAAACGGRPRPGGPLTQPKLAAIGSRANGAYLAACYERTVGVGS
jgi:hypothetical protein